MTFSELTPAGTGEGRDVAKEFLLVEYSRYQEALAKNEELGERRVQFFLGLVTAAAGAIALLATAEKGAMSTHPEYITWIACGLSLLLLATGLLTYDRLLKRDETTTEYQALLDEVRRRFTNAGRNEKQTLSLEGYDPFPQQKRRLLKRVGRLARLTMVINSWIAGLAAIMFWACVTGWPRERHEAFKLAILSILAILATVIGQWAWWKVSYGAPKREQ